jgi:hypothetical protein
LIAGGELEFPFQDVKDLRFVAMDVQRWPVAGRDRLFEDRVGSAGLFALDLEGGLVAKDAYNLALAGLANDGHCRLCLGKKSLKINRPGDGKMGS